MSGRVTARVLDLLSLLLLLCNGVTSSACNIDLSTRQAWVAAVEDSFATTHNISKGSLIFASVGTISNPSGTYGSHNFPDQTLTRETCECLEGKTCSYAASPPTYSNYDVEGPCKGTFSAEASVALVTVGCLPPSAVQYFAYQTNVFARHHGENGVFFPEVSPLPSLNQLTMSASSWGDPYIVVTTGSQEIADTVKETLVAAGAPEESVYFDGLSHPSVQLSSGDDSTTPDVLEVVVRLNHDNFTPELIDYIADSSTEQLALFLEPLDTPTKVDLLPASPLRTREVDPDQRDFSAELDDLTASITSKLAEQGYVLSYSGIAGTAMDYGYNAQDTDKCCLEGYFDNDSYWKSMIHFSTNDCLYQSHGAWTDVQNGWNEGQPALIGTPLTVNYEAIGEEAYIESFSTFRCSDSGGGEPELLYACASDTCDDDSCQFTSLEKIPALEACHPSPSNDKLFYKYECTEEGDAVMALYLTEKCTGLKVSENVLDGCYNSTAHLEGEIWAGGYIRDTTVAFVVGAMTNKLGLSSFHNIYLPSFSSYNDPTSGDKFSFSETSLEGSSPLWGGDESLFAAQFSRRCVGDNDEFCKIVGFSDKPTGQAFDIMSRQYLDPRSETGPNREEISRHRVLIYDKIQV